MNRNMGSSRLTFSFLLCHFFQRGSAREHGDQSGGRLQVKRRTLSLSHRLDALNFCHRHAIQLSPKRSDPVYIGFGAAASGVQSGMIIRNQPRVSRPP
jgi:hypothetical protein